MIILEESVSSQTIKFIPRYYTGSVMKLTNETTGEILTYSINPVKVEYYHSIDVIVNTKEGNFYSMAIFNDDDELVYRDKVFCTNQDIDSYTINKDEYIENATNNDYIVYE